MHVYQQLFLPKQSSEEEQRLCCNHPESAFGSKYAYKSNNGEMNNTGALLISPKLLGDIP